MAQTRSKTGSTSSGGSSTRSRSGSSSRKGGENIFFFVPNLIGLTRVILGFGAFWTARDDPYMTCWLYFWSCILDALDGYAARAFNQSTKFGAVLDMVTDRCTTTLLLVQLACLYGENKGQKEWTFACQCLIALDISSHWFHMYTTMARGGGSHKETTNPLLRMYYYKPILFTMCLCNDSFFCALYAVFWTDGPVIPFLNMGFFRAGLYACAPLCALKQLTNLIQLVEACRDLAAIDVKERSGKAR